VRTLLEVLHDLRVVADIHHDADCKVCVSNYTPAQDHVFDVNRKVFDRLRVIVKLGLPAVKVLVRCLTHDLALDVRELLIRERLIAGVLLLQISFTIPIHGVDIDDPVLVCRLKDHEVGWHLEVLLQPHNVPWREIHPLFD